MGNSRRGPWVAHVHGEVTAILLVPLHLPFPPCTLHALRRVGGGCVGCRNECHDRKLGAEDRRRRAVLILYVVSDAEELEWCSGAVALRMVRSQPPAIPPYKRGHGWSAHPHTSPPSSSSSCIPLPLWLGEEVVVELQRWRRGPLLDSTSFPLQMMQGRSPAHKVVPEDVGVVAVVSGAEDDAEVSGSPLPRSPRP
jgi:hypothetical protein